MLFNSHGFILIFLPLTLLIFYALCKYASRKLATSFLVLASLTFYSYWDIRYTPLLITSMLVNFFLGTYIEKTLSKRLLTVGVIFNLSLLVFFKYTCFLIQSCNYAFGSTIFAPEIIMPIGISFFTFTQLAYLIDAYRGETSGYDLLSYSLFVTFFPHLIAGPILYHKDIIPQFKKAYHFTFQHKNIAAGFAMFLLGLAKKIFIADSLSVWVKPVFDHASRMTFFDAWGGALAYTFQLYFDFSGYSDMAIGLGLMLNIHLPVNFNSPYKSTSIIEFWRRWHITLSAFLKNYLYIPLGGNRHGELRKAINILLTMLLGGLWHGAGWTFVIWGGLHGLFLLVNHLWRKLKIELPRTVAWCTTFLAVVVGWVFFRAQSLKDALSLLKTMSGINGLLLPESLSGKFLLLDQLGFKFGKLQEVASTGGLGALIGLLVAILYLENSQEFLLRLRPKWYWAFGMGILAAVIILRLNRPTEFLYFQF